MTTTTWRDEFEIETRDILPAEFWAILREWDFRITYMTTNEDGRGAYIKGDLPHLSVAKRTEFLEDVHVLDCVESVGVIL